MNTFLPADYKVPDTNPYLTLATGDNKLRILSDAITGYLYWTNDKKPVRSKEPFKTTPNIRTDKDGSPERVKHFWNFVAWDYNAEMIKICEITQSTVQTGIMDLISNSDWGDPTGYDITIKKSGERKQTKYAVIPSNKGKVADDIAKGYKESHINLNALYTGDNPFETDKEQGEISLNEIFND